MPIPLMAGLPWFSVVVALLAVTTMPGQIPAVRAGKAAATLDSAVQTTTSQLRQSWQRDPVSADLPFPSVRVLTDGVNTDATCSPPPLATYCSRTNQVLLNRTNLNPRFLQHGQWAVAFWIATALGERISQVDNSAALAPAAANLQATCLGGILLENSRIQKPTAIGDLLGPALKAYGAKSAAIRGEGDARGYALLSGFGATASLCSAAEMKKLANGLVPDSDQTLLNGIKDLTRGSSSLVNAFVTQCRPRRKAPCPPSLPRSLNRTPSSSS